MKDITITLTKEELEVIKYALMDRECRMLRDADTYKAQKNLDAQKDCLDEWRKAHNLAERLSNNCESEKPCSYRIYSDYSAEGENAYNSVFTAYPNYYKNGNITLKVFDGASVAPYITKKFQSVKDMDKWVMDAYGDAYKIKKNCVSDIFSGWMN